ncbi:MAG: ankyrin repeat domain-containing protein [Pseudobacteriovorax sp.]|nr:ankyrin repeat domain-containing protein [Pseudobacteriovorax sp.]
MALIFATEAKDTKMVKRLLKSGADANGLARARPICHAVMENHISGIKLLLEYGAEINPNLDTQPSFEDNMAIARQQPYSLVGFYDAQNTNSDWYSFRRRNKPKRCVPLNYAVLFGDESLVSYLLKEGARPNRDTIYYALMGSNLRVLKSLLDMKVTVPVDALRELAAGQHVHAKYLIDAGASVKYAAVHPADVDTLKLLLKHGLNPRQRYGKSQSTLLHEAAKSSVSATKILLEQGASVEAKTVMVDDPIIAYAFGKGRKVPGGDTPLHYAVRPNAGTTGNSSHLSLDQKIEIVTSLLDFGADPNQPNELGYSPIQIAKETSPRLAQILETYIKNQ